MFILAIRYRSSVNMVSNKVRFLLLAVLYTLLWTVKEQPNLVFLESLRAYVEAVQSLPDVLEDWRRRQGWAFHSFNSYSLLLSLHLVENKDSGRCVCGKQKEQGKVFPQRDEEIPQPGHLWADCNSPAELQDIRQLGSPAVKDGGLNWGREYPRSVQRCVFWEL